MKKIGLFCVVILLFAACASKKKATSSSPSKHGSEVKRSEYKKLSEQLNVPVDESCNIQLYRFVSDWIGTPHKDGGCDKRGTDCSCFVRMAYEHTYNKKLPRTSAEMFSLSKRVGKGKLKEGDLVFFKIKSSKISHVGIYLKDNWFAHASTSKGVIINSLTEPYYEKSYAGAGEMN